MSHSPAAAEATAPSRSARNPMLDGWRAVSILAVLAGHLLPIGPKAWQLNAAVAASGMAIFFTLSGFLIANLLIRDPDPVPFVIHRLFRILPLAWLAMGILAIANQADAWTVAANFLFFANLPPAHLMRGGEPLWSLCVEVQFYAGIALVVTLFGKRGLRIIPAAALAITTLRIAENAPISIITWERVDEILAGSLLALLAWRRGNRARPWCPPRVLTLVFSALLLLSAHPLVSGLPFLRPYFAAAAVGCSLWAAPGWMQKAWCSRPARYVAEISYALYVFHGMLSATWLGGEGASKFQRHLRLPLLVAVTFLCAHVSTRFYERRWIDLGRRLAARGGEPDRPTATVVAP